MLTSQTLLRCRQGFLLAFVFVGFFFAGAARNALGYEDDTHFWLTYYLARKANFTHIQATQIASATVGVDYDPQTEPVSRSPDNIFDGFHWLGNMQDIHAKFHAMPWKVEVKPRELPMMQWDPTEIPASWRPAAKVAVDKRKRDLWSTTWINCDNPGIFLHYLQDSFAHEGFLGFIGHQGYEHVDFLATDPGKAQRMAEMIMRYLIAYRNHYGTSCALNAPLDAESIDLARELPAGTLEDIHRVVARFIAANPSPGRTETNVMLTWRSLSPEDQGSAGLFPKGDMRLAILGRLECSARPDSYLARNIVADEFRLPSAQVPKIWIYDFSSEGVIRRPVTREYFSYLPERPVHNVVPGNSRVEKANKSLTCPTPSNYTMVDCLAYRLVADDVNAIPRCRLRRNDAVENVGACQLK